MTLAASDFSLIVPTYGVSPPDLAGLIDLALHAEAVGYYSFGLTHVPVLPRADERGPDHVANFVPLAYRDYQLDPLVLAPILARATTTIRVGFNVLVTPWLHPYVWAKYLASLDAVSDGRLVAGFGLGFSMPGRPARSLQAIGIDSASRGLMADEALRLIHQLWSSTERISFDGDFYQGAGLVVMPKSTVRPHPEVWWAGNAEPSIARAARYARYLELSFPTAKLIQSMNVALKRQNSELGTDCSIAAQLYARVTSGSASREATVVELFGGSAELDSLAVGTPIECATVITALHSAGAAHFVLNLNRGGRDDLQTYHRQIDLFAAEVLPLLQIQTGLDTPARVR